MTVATTLGLFAAMVVLAAVPSVSVLAVAGRASVSGFVAGAWVALGIVAGDLVFVVIALCGLSLFASSMAGVFLVARYVCGVYLLWSGVQILRSPGAALRVGADGESGGAANFLTGLFITLADQKAVLFYLGFFPAFVDLARVGAVDVAVIAVVTCGAVGGVKLAYAAAAERTGRILAAPGAARRVKQASGVAMAGVGVFLLLAR